MLWVTRADADDVAEEVLRERAGADSGVEVRTKALSGCDTAKIPAGSCDEWGTKCAEALNVASDQLPPEGRLYLIDEA